MYSNAGESSSSVEGHGDPEGAMAVETASFPSPIIPTTSSSLYLGPVTASFLRALVIGRQGVKRAHMDLLDMRDGNRGDGDGDHGSDNGSDSGSGSDCVNPLVECLTALLSRSITSLSYLFEIESMGDAEMGEAESLGRIPAGSFSHPYIPSHPCIHMAIAQQLAASSSQLTKQR